MKKLLTVSLLATLLIGCGSLNTKVYRTERLVADTSVGALKVWTTYYKQSTNGASVPVIAMLDLKANQVNQISKEIGTALAITEELRVQYGTNTAIAPLLKASVVTLENQSSNIVWLVNALVNIK